VENSILNKSEHETSLDWNNPTIAEALKEEVALLKTIILVHSESFKEKLLEACLNYRTELSHRIKLTVDETDEDVPLKNDILYRFNNVRSNPNHWLLKDLQWSLKEVLLFLYKWPSYKI
jgi:hypothetical protein